MQGLSDGEGVGAEGACLYIVSYTGILWLGMMGGHAVVEVFEVGGERKIFEHGSSEGGWGGHGLLHLSALSESK